SPCHAEFGSKLVQRSRLDVICQAHQVSRRTALLILILWNGDVEPAVQGGVDVLAVLRADVVAMGALRRLARKSAAACRECQVCAGIVKAVDGVQPAQDRVMFLVPGEFVGINQPPRRGAADDEPGEEAVTRRATEIPGGFPATSACVVERNLRV